VVVNAEDLPGTHQGVDAVVDEARRRQDALVARVRGLAADRRALDDRLKHLSHAHDDGDDTDGDAGSPGLLASLSRRLRRRRRERTAPGPHGEAALRARVEAALQETKKASWLADRFGALRQELDDEVRALHALSARATAALSTLQQEIVSARVVSADASAAAAVRDEASRQRAQAERQERVLALLVERLAVQLASARGVIDIVDALHDDVDAFVRAASTWTEGLSARARAVGVAEDARAVLVELEGALSSLGGTLDEAAIFATAVSERIAQTPSSDPAFQQSLDALVKGALARRSATSAVEQAAGLDPHGANATSSSSPPRGR
jgi:hypothetical protein